VVAILLVVGEVADPVEVLAVVVPAAAQIQATHLPES
jgi:hypothetical protein